MPRNRKPIKNIEGMTSCSSPVLGFVVRLSATYEARTMIANVGMKANAIRRGAYQVTSPLSHHCMGKRCSPENRILARSASHIITAAKADPIVSSTIVSSPSVVFSFLGLRPQCWRVRTVRFRSRLPVAMGCKVATGKKAIRSKSEYGWDADIRINFVFRLVLVRKRTVRF
jgi:hypothetical protein